MRLLKWLIVLAMACPATAAITEYYVTTTGAGTKDGTSEANAHSWTELNDAMTVGGSYTAAAGNRYNIKAGTYSISATDTWTADGTTASPIIFRGYNSTIGDLATQGRTSAQQALNTTNFPVLSYASGTRLNAAGSSNCVFAFLTFRVASTYVNGALLNLGINSIVFRCDSDNPSTGANAAAIGLSDSQGVVIDCDAVLSGASGGLGAINCQGSTPRVIACRVVDSQTHGISAGFTAGHCVFINNVVANCAGDGITYYGTTASVVITCIGNTVYNCGGQGISLGNAAFTGVHVFANNHVTDCGANGFYSNYDGTAQLAGVFVNNRTRDNVTSAINGFDDWAAATSWGHVTTDNGNSYTDYTNPGSNDFTLISAAPAKGTGLLPYMDIGALQRQESGSGVSRARVVNPQ